MPQAAAAAIIAAFKIVPGTLAAKAITAATYVAFAVGTQALIASLQKPPKPGDRKEGLRGEIMPRPVNFGRTLAGSSVVYDDVASDKTRYQVHVHNHGPVENVIERRFSGKPYQSTDAGMLLPNSRWRDGVFAELNLGAEDQPASRLMLSGHKGAALIAPGWTPDHRLRGLTYSVIRAPSTDPTQFTRVYPEGRPPVPTIIGDFGKPFDPRSGERRFTTNGALQFAWFLTHPLGGRMPENRIDWDAFALAADAADRLGYEIAGSWLADEAPKVAQANMLAALDASMWVDQTGRVRLDLGEWRDPVVTITADHVLQIQSLSAGSEEGEALTEQIVKFPDRDRDYSEVEEVAWTIDGPVYEPRVAELAYCPTKTQALRLGRRIARRETARWRLECTLNLAGLRLINTRIFEVHLPQFGLSHQAMELDGWAFDTATGQVSIRARSVSEADFT